MKKIALLLLLAASFSMPAFAADGAEPIKLISYNLRTSHGKDGDNVWMKRRHATPEMIRREAPDVFGVQEGLIDQLHYIDTECPQYARVGVGRDDGAEKGEFMAVYYLRDRFELLDSGTFWLSETPDKVSRGWDGACNRTVTWVELKDRKSGKEFFYFNTHLDHKGKAAREEGVKLGIVQKSGAWFNYGDIRLGQGRDNAKQFLKDNPEIANDIEGQIRANADKLYASRRPAGKGAAAKAEEPAKAADAKEPVVKAPARSSESELDIMVED